MVNVHVNENNTVRYTLNIHIQKTTKQKIVNQLKRSSSISNRLKGLALAFLWLLPHVKQLRCKKKKQVKKRREEKKNGGSNRWYKVKRERCHQTPQHVRRNVYNRHKCTGCQNGGKTWPTNVYLYSKTTICLFFRAEIYSNFAKWTYCFCTVHYSLTFAFICVVVAVVLF